MSISVKLGRSCFHSVFSMYSITKLWYRLEAFHDYMIQDRTICKKGNSQSITTSIKATTLGPPVRFRRTFISLLIFLVATGFRTFITHCSWLNMSRPSKTYPNKVSRQKTEHTTTHLRILPSTYTPNDFVPLWPTPVDPKIVYMRRVVISKWYT